MLRKHQTFPRHAVTCCVCKTIISITLMILSAGCCAVPFQNGTCNSASSTSSSVFLYWLRTQSATYYQITYSRLNDEMVTMNATSTSVNVTLLTAGYLYTFYLQSFSAAGASSKSNCSYSTCKFIF